MHLPGLLIIASLATLSKCAVLPKDGGALGGQLTSYDALYSSLHGGIRVRYFVDLAACQLISGKQYPAEGGVVDAFVATSRISSTSFVTFSSQLLDSLSPVTTTLSEYQVFSDKSVIAVVSTLNPATFQVLDHSQYMCSLNDGSAGNVYFFSTAPSPPSLHTSYSDISLTLVAGFTVLYSIDYGKCHPVPVFNITQGGTIDPYQTIPSSSNPGLRTTQVKLTAVGYDTTVMSLFQNGTVNVDVRTLKSNYQPIVTQFVSCTINSGSNNGGVSFYARKPTATDHL